MTISFPIRSLKGVPAGSAVSIAFPSKQVMAFVWMTIWAMGLRSLEFPHNAPARVLQLGDGFEMVGVDAASHAASMVNVQPFRDRAFEQLVCETVSEDSFTIETYLRVSALDHASSPKPASGIWFRRNLIQKSVKYTECSHSIVLVRSNRSGLRSVLALLRPALNYNLEAA